MKLLKASSTLCYLFLISIYTYLIWFKLDLSRMDLAGHIASAAQFARSGMHSFNDRMFLGTTHNLFYPPLEDILINLVRVLSFQDYIVSFQVYLTFLLIGFLAVLFSIGKNFTSKAAFLFYHASILSLLTIDKGWTLYLQGMSFDDLFVIGLTNQFLSGIGLLWICKEIMVPTRNIERNIILGAVISVLSHIVVGAVSLGVVFLFSFLNKKERSKLFLLVLILGMCAFYLAPFIVYKSYITNSNIFVDSPWVPFFIAVTSLGLSYRVYESRVLLILSCILFSTVTIFSAVGFLSSLLPSFHYYRFTVLAYYLFILGVSHFLNKRGDSKVLCFVMSLLGLVFVCDLLYRFDLRRNFFEMPKVSQNEVKLKHHGHNNSSFGRALLFSSDRTAGTSIESLLTLNSGESRFSKGLFWESSYTNLVESSFLATLLTPPVVLDYFYYYGYSCEIRRCLMEEHFRLYNIKDLIANFDELDYIAHHERDCYKGMIAEGTERYSFNKKDTFSYDSKTYHAYEIVSKQKMGSSPLSAVELISVNQVRISDSNLLLAAEKIVVDRFKSCQNPAPGEKSFSVLLSPKDETKFKDFRSRFQTYGVPNVFKRFVDLQKVSDHEYTFHLPNVLSWYVLKISPQPGMKILNHAGVEMPLLRGVPYTIGVGSGSMKVVFQRTWVMWLGYVISALSLFLFFDYFWFKKIDYRRFHRY